ncbi:unnamed protein product [Trifolium pratense]|uniref:Uncharacterized protein n=1 Tax=Trifolium pratense TaxID=57577 RepID=A0ACB0LLX9_TRIPR|nr:unnamed protein product [Trifolium pratense]
MRIVSSKIRSFVTNGSLTYDQEVVAARHFDVKRFEMETHIWLGFTNTQKVDYIESPHLKLVETLFQNMSIGAGTSGAFESVLLVEHL